MILPAALTMVSARMTAMDNTNGEWQIASSCAVDSLYLTGGNHQRPPAVPLRFFRCRPQESRIFLSDAINIQSHYAPLCLWLEIVIICKNSCLISHCVKSLDNSTAKQGFAHG